MSKHGTHRAYAQRAWTVVASTCSLLLAVAGCATLEPQEDDVSSRGNGLDETVACPEGYVGFNFSEDPIDLRSAYYQAAKEGGVDFSAGYITVESVTCGGDAWESELDSLDSSCGGRVACWPKPQGLIERTAPFRGTTSVPCPTQRVITYTCGNTAVDAQGQLRRFTATGDERLSCALQGEPPPTRSVCVPRYCQAKSHRDENLNCVPDETMPTIPARNPGVSRVSIGPVYETGNARPESAYDATLPLLANVPYRVTMNVAAKRSATVTTWMADVYRSKGSTATDWKSSDTLLVFRCTAMLTEASTDFPGAGTDSDAKVDAIHTISPECFDAEARVRAELVKRVGSGADSYEKVETRMFHSYDVLGTVAIGGDDEAACAPNPPEFFPLPDGSGTDIVAYYKQRLMEGSWRSDGWTQLAPTRVDPRDEAPSYMYLVGEAMHLGKSAITVQLESVGNEALPVDVDWSMPNYDPRNPLAPGNIWSDKPNGWTTTVVTDNAATSGTDYEFDLSTSNYALPNLRATVYVQPQTTESRRLHIPAGGPLEIGSVPLTKPVATGSTASKDLRLTSNVRRAFYDENSEYYISPQQRTRLFDVFFCFTTDYRDKTIDLRYWDPKWGSEDCSAGAPVGRYCGDPSATTVSAQTLGRGLLGLPLPETKTWSLFVKGNGDKRARTCVMADTPLSITASRMVRPVTPIQRGLFEGEMDVTSSGDSDALGTQQNGNERTCSDDDESHCTSVVTGGMASTGAMGRSFYTTTATIERRHGESVESDFTGEMLGFQAFDMNDDEANSADEGLGWQKTEWLKREITITVTPPWGAIYQAAKNSTRLNPRLRWALGKYGSQSGLGLGVGIEGPLPGPIPGTVSASASVGIGVSAELKLSFELDEQYPCLSSSPSTCTQVELDRKTLAEAHEACTEQGGRLYEVRTEAERSELSDLLADSAYANRGPYWLGGQLAYEYMDPDCVEPGRFDPGKCLPSATSSYRWLSDDREFARSVGGGSRAEYVAGASAFGAPDLYSVLPKSGGLAYAPMSRKFLLVDQPQEAAQKLAYVCAFQSADDERGFGWTLSLKTGVAAGVGVGVCSPTSDIGVCIEGSLNFVAVDLALEWANEYRWLYRNSQLMASTQNMSFSAPWSITLLQASMTASAKLGVLSTSWTFFEYGGFKVAEGKLFEIDASYRQVHADSFELY